MSQLRTLLASNRLDGRFEKIYPQLASEAKRVIVERLERWLDGQPASESLAGDALRSDSVETPAGDLPGWTEADVVLITYGDQIQSSDTSPLLALRDFLVAHDLPRLLNTVHFLPFFPSSSDDGFSVVDYRKIDPEIGDWDGVRKVGEVCQLMFDFVVNHASQQCDWFQNYLKGVSPFDEFFIDVDPRLDLSQVTRPRSLPLLTEFDTTDRGKRFLWTTFSADQIDLNYRSPRLLGEVLSILLDYVEQGARIVRLDAIAYLWKDVATNCIHRPETHEVVKLMRDVLTSHASDVLLLTETNVPHQENVSYFGDGDEAHMVYQFSLPPLLLDAFLNDDAVPLKHWLRNLERPPRGCTFFNFTASHDGVGVRPLEDLIPATRMDALVSKIRDRGGLIGTRRQPDGTDAPYELNIAYVDAVRPDPADDATDDSLHASRFLATQAVMMSLQGMPAIYFHSLVGTQNDLEGVAASNINRRINRRRFTIDEIDERLAVAGSLQRTIFDGMQRLMAIRTRQAAFHPDADQQYIESGNANVLCFLRTSVGGDQSILVIVNFDHDAQTIELPDSFRVKDDLLGLWNVSDESNGGSKNSICLRPAQVAWLVRA